VEPKVLLLDEPFGALDAQVRKELRTWLLELHRETGVTTVLVTHDQEEAMEVADHIAVIREGRLEQVGTPAECYDHPATDFVLTFLGPATRLSGEWIRPHDLEITREANGSGRAGTVRRIVHLGFEVRVEVEMADGSDIFVQMARRTFEELALVSEETVYVSIAPGQVAPAHTLDSATPRS
jgi:sulfate transport system ATP-binding protein